MLLSELFNPDSPIVLVTFAIFLVIFIYNACILKHRPPPSRTRVEQVNEQWQTTFDGSPAPCGKEENPDKSRVVRFEGVQVVKGEADEWSKYRGNIEVGRRKGAAQVGR